MLEYKITVSGTNHKTSFSDTEESMVVQWDDKAMLKRTQAALKSFKSALRSRGMSDEAIKEEDPDVTVAVKLRMPKDFEYEEV